MQEIDFSRRDFISSTLFGAAIVPYLYGCGVGARAETSSSGKLEILRRNAIQDPDCEWCGARDVPDDVSWKTRLVKDGGPGERMKIDGTVYETDGITPAADILIYTYHTDNEGLYGRKSEPRHGRYRGWVLTGEDGRYSFYTIKPAPYPNRREAAHVHMTVTGLNRKEDWLDSIMFEGDPFLKPQDISDKRGGYINVIKLTKDTEGILRGTRDLRLPRL
jgi:protocatechuate 3,4-dioxygenase beta subunit